MGSFACLLFDGLRNVQQIIKLVPSYLPCKMPVRRSHQTSEVCNLLGCSPIFLPHSQFLTLSFSIVTPSSSSRLAFLSNLLNCSQRPTTPVTPVFQRKACVESISLLRLPPWRRQEHQ